MATIKSNSPLFGASGRLGSVITYELNGVQVIRALPYTKKRKTTDLQQAHRESFQIQHRIAKSLKVKIIQRIWDRFSYQGGMNGYNRFIQINRPVYGPSGDIEFPELMVVSQGKLNPAKDFVVTYDGNNLQFTWTPGNQNLHSSDTDKLNVVLLNSRCFLTVFETGISRKEGQAVLPFSASANENPVGYVFWSSANDKDFSPSIYWISR